jgi:hypothetical protein
MNKNQDIDIVAQIEKQLASEDVDMVDMCRLLEDAANEIRKLRGQSEKPTGFSDKVP